MDENQPVNVGDTGLIPGHKLQLLKTAHLRPELCNKKSHRNERPEHHNQVKLLLDATRESLHTKNEDPEHPEINK